MQWMIDQQGSSKVALVEGEGIAVNDVQDALDLMANIGYEHDCRKILLDQSQLSEQFFDLKTKLAGDILQKFVNYQVKLAITGNVQRWVDASKSLKDFIYECNQGKQFLFIEDRQEALQALHSLK